jgi:hypothetical protein
MYMHYKTLTANRVVILMDTLKWYSINVADSYAIRKSCGGLLTNNVSFLFCAGIRCPLPKKLNVLQLDATPQSIPQLQVVHLPSLPFAAPPSASLHHLRLCHIFFDESKLTVI